ncbi:MAG: hypothetical protein ACRC4N_03710 [Gammaproteobacteria bacterium]
MLTKQFVCVCVWGGVCLSVYLSICPVYLPIDLYICLSVLSICLSCLPADRSIHLSVYLLVY